MSPEQRLIRTMVQSFAEIIERQVLRFENQGAEYERKLAEHRASFAARTGADEKIIEGMRSQVQDMRAEMERLREDERKAYQAGVALQAEVAALQERLRASIARGDFAQMEVAALKSQTPKHPVKVGEWVKRLTPSPMTPAGGVAKVTDVFEVLGLAVKIERPDGIKGTWWAKSCEPCDPPATIKREPKIGDTVRLVTHPERAKVAKHLQIALQWPWLPSWGLVGQTGKVVKPLVAVAGAVAVALDGSTIFARWPIDCLEVVSEANHDTEAGKAVAESVVSEPIKVGDVVKVVGASGCLTAQSDIGKIGEVLKIDFGDGTVLLPGWAGWVNRCDVRKVTT